ncbi:cytochrome c biogenesis protein ResB [Sutcliffiella rhizosphaerae]|uniref:Cytochrome c biogenesis protein Ccs1 n=1 Tax=Sutcliffiella rhizosphaerae TaxID=2880967 RepID=A0ABN8AAX7_9BACI|nr:cytochrome c biogenesis protein ResB [Sutcliffiella rhizosphaerae]CAG9622335.1 Cytochrome c biogenesis protein Ccs1 [Sutcliffiella rhizosphaerae]
MKEIKCECGHLNPEGTILCEACGKPTVNEQSNEKLLDMKYEGSARRSKTYNKTIIDKVWNFFSSVKVGIWIIFIILVASSIGTIFPQQDYINQAVPPQIYYEQEYGFVGKLYYTLGFHNLYGSWWYMLLIAALGISLVIASLDRYIPLRKSLKTQKVTRHESFMKRQRVFGTSETTEEAAKQMEIAKQGLIKRKYNVREENGNLLAEKYRFSRWGPYVNHIGIIIFLIGAMLRFFPGMYVDEVVWVREGETRLIPGTNGQYYLKNEGFLFETYDSNNSEDVFNQAITQAGDGAIARNFQTNAVLFERKGEFVVGAEPELEIVKEHQIKVNQPLKHDYYALYQVDYKLNEFKSMSFYLENKETGESVGELTVDLLQPENSYDLGNGNTVELVNYFPDFELVNGEPVTKTRIPDNPAFVFRMITPDTPEGEIALVAIRQNIEPNGTNEYKMTFAGVDTRNVTGLTVRRDLTLWILGTGGAIFMIGVIQGMYWNHRRVWIQNNGKEFWVAGHTNKNWFGLKNDISKALENTSIRIPVDQVEEDKQQEKKTKEEV